MEKNKSSNDKTTACKAKWLNESLTLRMFSFKLAHDIWRFVTWFNSYAIVISLLQERFFDEGWAEKIISFLAKFGFFMNSKTSWEACRVKCDVFCAWENKFSSENVFVKKMQAKIENIAITHYGWRDFQHFLMQVVYSERNRSKNVPQSTTTETEAILRNQDRTRRSSTFKPWASSTNTVSSNISVFKPVQN